MGTKISPPLGDVGYFIYEDQRNMKYTTLSVLQKKVSAA